MITIFIIVTVLAAAEGANAQGAAPAEEAQPPESRQAAPPEPEPEPIYEETIDVTVERQSEADRRRESAEAVQVVETEAIQREAVDMGTALARTEGVEVRRAGGLGSRARFSLGGFTDEQIRFFIDGVPLELAGFGPGIANVPVNLIQRVEIYQGVVPGRFGADALGGAVHLVTDQEVRETGAAASYEVGSFDTHRLTAGVRHFHEPTRFLVRAHGFFDHAGNDYPITVEAADEQGRVKPARVYRFHDSFRAAGAGVEAGFVDQPWARRLLLHGFASRYGKDIQHNISMRVPYGEVDSGELSGGATLRYEQALTERLSVDAVAGYTWRRTNFSDLGTCAYDWFGRCVQELPQPGEIQSRAVERLVGQHTGFARIHAAWDLAGPHMLRFSLAPTLVVRGGEDRQLRARQEPDPLEGARNIRSLVGGLEYEFYTSDDRLENIVFLKGYVLRARSEKLLPSGDFQDVGLDTQRAGVGDSLRYRLSGKVYAKASYEWAVRLPRPDEFFGDGILVLENLSLQPENSHNVNLGLTLDGTETARGTFRGSVLAFGRLADQLILPIPEDTFITYHNVYKARVVGATGAVGWTSPGEYVALDGNVTWQDLRNISDQGRFGTFDGQRIPNRPYLLANGSAAFRLKGLMSERDELSLAWHSRYIHSFFRAWERLGLAGPKQVIPAQFLHSLALTYVTRSERTTLSWTVDVQNLTDVSAFDFYGVQRPGRSIFSKLTVELGGSRP